MDDYAIVGTTRHRGDDVKTELHRLYYSTIDSLLGEMDNRFSERNSKLASALVALDPESDTLVHVKAVKHIMDLLQSPRIESTKVLNSFSDHKNNHSQSRRNGPYSTSSLSTTHI